MPRKSPKVPRFKPPVVTDPPTLVEIDWVDAQVDIEDDGPVEKSEGLVRLPRAGYHVYNGSNKDGAFFLIAAEWCRDEDGVLIARDRIAIHPSWVRAWRVVTGLQQTWPPPETPQPGA